MIPQWIKKLDEIISNWCVAHSHNIADLRWYARLREPKPMFGYMDGAADSEVTLARNQADFARYDLLPRYLMNVQNMDGIHLLKIIDNKNISVNGLSKAIKNTPALFISGHFSNWEIILSLLIETKLPVQITYRKLNNPFIDSRIRKQREKNGARFLIQKSGQTSARNLLKALKNKQSIAMLNDQKFNQGISVPFFGVNAMTSQGFVRLALKTNLPLLPVIVTRKKSKFTINFYEPINLIRTKNKSLDVENGVIQINEFIEDRIRENPDQWFWAHRRWPNLLYE